MDKERYASHLVEERTSLMETIDMATDNLGNGGESPFDSAKKAFGDTAASFSDQAGARARDYAAQGKDRAVEALDNVASLVGDAANQVSGKLGEQYGGYIQQAADAVSGFATTLREKDTDDLLDDARSAVRSSPAIAIAAAAAVGFLVARVVKSGLTPKAGGDSPSASPAPAPLAATPRKPAARKAAPVQPAAAKAAPAKAATKPKARAAAPKAPLADTPIADGPAPGGPTPAA